MSSEGELKKQKGALFTILEDLETQNIIMDKHSSFSPIIDEAKKDLLEGHIIDTVTPYDFVCIDYKKWKKWFGDSDD